MIRLYHQNVTDFLENTENQYNCIFMDPPDNLGLTYDYYDDDKPEAWYQAFLVKTILDAMKICTGVVWVSYYWKHDFWLKAKLYHALRRYAWGIRTFHWRFTFGQHNTHDCGNGYRPILRITHPCFVCPDYRIKSVRQELGDSRADPRGKMPDDVWFDIPRVTGNSRERRSWHPTQHPEELMRRIFSLSGPGKILDLFTGTGTSIRVAKKLNLDCVELSDEYCTLIEKEHNIRREKCINTISVLD